MARGFSGVQKAAILVMQVGKDRAAPILRSMREQEVAEIMAEVRRLVGNGVPASSEPGRHKFSAAELAA